MKLEKFNEKNQQMFTLQAGIASLPCWEKGKNYFIQLG